MNDWTAWLHEHSAALGWLTAASVLMFLAGLLVVPAVVVRIPRDYFATKKRKRPAGLDRRHWLLRAAVLVLKNAAAYLLIVAGVLMLVLPGQGVLTILAGVMLADFPGKFRLERWLITRGPTLRAVNWLRHRAGRKPLVVDG